jgi:hypothetical protein
MHKNHCYKKDCTRIRSEFSIFLNRRRPPTYEGNIFCSDACLRAHVEGELNEKWRRMQIEKKRTFPRPKLGTILMQTAYVTREQLDQAIRLQNETHEGRIGEWLLRLGFVEEHQITVALARQFGLPLINLNKSDANNDAVRMIPGKVAKCSGLVPVGLDDSQSTLRVAVSAPVNFSSQEAIRRMVRKGIVAYMSDQTAINRLLEQAYEPEDLDLSNVPTFRCLEDLVEIGNELVSTAVDSRAQDIQAELMQDILWIRLDFPSETHHHFFRYALPVEQPQAPVPARTVMGHSTRNEDAILTQVDGQQLPALDEIRAFIRTRELETQANRAAKAEKALA